MLHSTADSFTTLEHQNNHGSPKIYADAAFDWRNYSDFRPSYSQELFDLILSQHRLRGGKFDLALDVGCGPGNSTKPLASYFEKVIGCDLSQHQLNVANEISQAQCISNISWKRSKAEDLSWLDDKSVDLVISGEGIHWFDIPLFTFEAHRVLRTGGTLAVWYYYPHGSFYDIPEAASTILQRLITRLACDFCASKYPREPVRIQTVVTTSLSYARNMAIAQAGNGQLFRNESRMFFDFPVKEWNDGLRGLSLSNPGLSCAVVDNSAPWSEGYTETFNETRNFMHRSYTLDTIVAYIKSLDIVPEASWPAVLSTLSQVGRLIGGQTTKFEMAFPLALVMGTKI